MDYKTATDVFRYDPMSGKLYWMDEIPRNYFSSDRAFKRAKSVYCGQEAGTTETGGYLQVRFQGVAYSVHRVIWLMFYGVWPSNHVDHEDHNRKNNQIKNLRDLTQAGNNAHKKNNKSGHPCIFFQVRSTNRPWMVQVYHQGKYLTQRSFAEISDAIAHRDAVRAQYGLPPI